MCLYAYRPKDHETNERQTICLGWDRQMPTPVGDWMLAWAVEEGSEAALTRAKSRTCYPLVWPGPYKSYESRREVWKLRRDHSDAMCDMCKWFYDGPCRSNDIVIDTNSVHHSFGCSGDLMSSDWFIKNLWIGEDAKANAMKTFEPEWLRLYETGDADDEDDENKERPMFCETQKTQHLITWTAETLHDARRRLKYMGEPVARCDMDALEETLDVLTWAEQHLRADYGVKLVCVHDF